MGSGMLPVGAYVTLEHEHILILRKDGRKFSPQETEIRRESAFFGKNEIFGFQINGKILME